MHKPIRLSIFAALAAASALLVMSSVGSAATVFNNSTAPQGAHYSNNSGEPVCSVGATAVSCTGTSIAGVGNTAATVVLSVTTTFSGVCHNPGTNSKVVEPFSDSDTNSSSQRATPSRNGRLDVAAQSTPIPSQEDFEATFTCPNPNWTPEVTSSGTSFTYTLTFDGFTQPAITISGTV
jgi:hypothetical protein